MLSTSKEFNGLLVLDVGEDPLAVVGVWDVDKDTGLEMGAGTLDCVVLGTSASLNFISETFKVIKHLT